MTWSCEEGEDGQRVKVLPVPSDKLDEDTAAAISAVSQGSTGALRIKMHNKLAALVVLGKYLGMFDERPQNSNVIYAISDEPMSLRSGRNSTSRVDERCALGHRVDILCNLLESHEKCPRECEP